MLFCTPGVGMQLSEVQTPDGGVRRWLRTTGSTPRALSLTAAQWERHGQVAAAPERYPIEAELLLDSGEVRGAVTLTKILHQQDPLGAIPEPLRTLLGWTLTMEPHQAWAEARYDLTVEGCDCLEAERPNKCIRAGKTECHVCCDDRFPCSCEYK